METFEKLAPPLAPAPLADADISAAIELLLLTKRGVDAHLIDVATHEGVVVLSGFTDSLLARARAEEIALAVRGVRGVVNELAIRTPELPDAALQRSVEQALAHDPAAATYAVACTVADGTVHLTGTVQTWQEKQLVRRVVQGVRGVRALVLSELRMGEGELTHTDEEITTEIRELLDWDIRVRAALVEVHTTHRIVYLAGAVGSAIEKSRLMAIAYQAGARQVLADELLVMPWVLEAALRDDKFAYHPDEAVAQAIRDTFRYDPRIRANEPEVVVCGGNVMLLGTVSNLRTKLDAEQDARHVVGVWDVQNHLKVRPDYLHADADIRQYINGALARDPYLWDFSLKVSVLNGKAYLDGQVSNHFEQAHAADVAAGITGVAEVENRLQVTCTTCTTGLPPSAIAPWLAQHPVPDTTLAERIRARFHWVAGLYNQGLAAQVANGVATLTGTVDTPHERDHAAVEAYEAGARYVYNNVQVRTPAQP